MQVKGVNFLWLWRIDLSFAHSHKLPSSPSKCTPPLADPWSLWLGKRDATVWLLTDWASMVHSHMSSSPQCGQAALCRHLVAMNTVCSQRVGFFFFTFYQFSTSPNVCFCSDCVWTWKLRPCPSLLAAYTSCLMLLDWGFLLERLGSDFNDNTISQTRRRQPGLQIRNRSHPSTLRYWMKSICVALKMHPWD